MRQPPELPQLAPAIHLLLSQAASRLQAGKKLRIMDVVQSFQDKEKSIWSDPSCAAVLSSMMDDCLVLPGTATHDRGNGLTRREQLHL